MVYFLVYMVQTAAGICVPEADICPADVSSDNNCATPHSSTARQVVSCCHAPWLSGMLDPPTSPEPCRTARQTHSSATAVLGFQVQFASWKSLWQNV